MTRKTRRTGTDDPTPQEPQDSKPRKRKRRAEPKRRKSPEEARDRPAEAERTEEEGATKVSLPAFGFAEDLLAKAPATADSDPAGATEAEATAEEEPAADADSRRIFRFADSLAQTAAEESAAVPVRLETWVAFSLAGEVFALPVEPVREVVRVASITRVPHAPRPIRGVTNMRGRVIPVIDLRLRIELPETDLGRASRVIVVGSRGRLLGLLVDAVHQVIHIDRSQIQPPPEDVMTVQSDYLSGVYHLDDQLILLLDIDRALIIHDPAATAANTEAEAARAAARDDASREAGAEDAPAGAA